MLACDATAQFDGGPIFKSASPSNETRQSIIRVIRLESLPRARRGGPRPCLGPTKTTADNADAADTVGSVMCLPMTQPLKYEPV